MTGFLRRRLFDPLIRLADGYETAPNERPSPVEETTRYPSFPWDLRTLIAVFPDDAPFRFLNLNVTLGLTGVPFDQYKNWTDKSPKDAFDLQFCLEPQPAGPARKRPMTPATYKAYHSVSSELAWLPDEVFFELPDRLRFEGRWPAYQIRYRQPEEDFSLDLALRSLPGFRWWAHAPRIYSHYTSFCNCRLRWSRGGRKGECDLPVLHDHGWGKNLLPLRLPLKLFRYEVMRLPDAGFAICLWTEGPAGLEIRNVGLVRLEQGPIRTMQSYACRVLEWETLPNYVGEPCRVARRWTGTLEGSEGRFRFEAERDTEPRPVLGEGFLYGVRYRGRFEGRGFPAGDLEGPGYVEHLGH